MEEERKQYKSVKRFIAYLSREVKARKNPLVNGVKLKSPCSYSMISNPLKNKEKTKRILRQHDELLRKTGVYPLKSPL